MIIFPAVDIKDRQCVRLKQGKAAQKIVFSSNPVDMAKEWRDQGASWLHVVDLDGAFDGKPINLDIIERLCSSVDIFIQMGGGIRDLATAKRYLNAGVNRIIIGTMALAEPDKFAEICRSAKGKVGVSLDAEKGMLKTKGWVEDSGQTVKDVLPKLAAQGASVIIYTDIERDGMQGGVNFDAISELCKLSPLPIIAAGGVAALEDVRKLYPLTVNECLEGAISGRALYEGTLKLPQAIAWIREQKKLGNPTLNY